MALSFYQPLCEALVLLLRPLVEIVIHDLETDRICFIQGGLSTRKVGDASVLGKEDFEIGLETTVYQKLAFDGRLIKSISVPVQGGLLICINCDASVFHQMERLSQSFLHIGDAPKPESLFKNDWQERMHLSVHSFLQEKGWRFTQLTGLQKKMVVRHLFENGAFQEPRAADYVAQTLSMGRATVFKYLKEWR